METFQLEKGCVLDVNELFFPSDDDNSSSNADVVNNGKSTITEFQRNKSLSLIHESTEKIDGEVSSKVLDNDDDRPTNNEEATTTTTTPVVYECLSKLRLSKCAIGETAGLRGRRRRRRTSASNNVPRIPTFARFPNLQSLNLSHNELFKTKTVFAGLSTLPQLSSINLSYNRLSR